MRNSKSKRKIIEILLYLGPALLLILFVFLFPIVMMFRYSLSRVKGVDISFIGLENYLNLFKDSVFIEGIKHSIFLLIGIPIMVVLSLLFSVLLYEQMAGWRFYRFSLFIPYILAVTVVGIVFSYIFQLNGILNFFLNRLHLGFLVKDWLGSSKFVMWVLMFVVIWKELGFGIMLFFARLMSVPKELYEAAKIDGASWIKMHLFITIPQLASVIEFYIVILIITMLSWVFNYVYVMTGGGPGSASMVTELYIYIKAFRYNNIGMASAASVILFFLTLGFILIQMRLRARESED